MNQGFFRGGGGGGGGGDTINGKLCLCENIPRFFPYIPNPRWCMTTSFLNRHMLVQCDILHWIIRTTTET